MAQENIYTESIITPLSKTLWLGLERVFELHKSASTISFTKDIPFDVLWQTPTSHVLWNVVTESTRQGSLYVTTLAQSLWTDQLLIQDPTYISLGLALVFGLVCFVLSIPTRNVSHVDRLWSLTPPLYVLIFALKDYKALVEYALTAAPATWSWATFTQTVDIRLIVMSFLTLLWGARLTFNFARKGGYKSFSEEDYRWAYVKKWPIVGSWVGWSIFNFTFISMYQHVLLWSITLPAYYAYHVRLTSSWTDMDSVATGLFLFFFCMETLADQQQWNFYKRRQQYRDQVAKAARVGKSVPSSNAPSNVAEIDVVNGFYTHGLFRFSRHPNFFAEQCIWWSFYLFSYGSLFDHFQDIKVSVIEALPETVEWTLSFGVRTLKTLLVPHVINESFIGALLLTLLFLGSVVLTEAISKSKYPAYQHYCKTTSRMIPWFPGGRMKLADKK